MNKKETLKNFKKFCSEYVPKNHSINENKYDAMISIIHENILLCNILMDEVQDRISNQTTEEYLGNINIIKSTHIRSLIALSTNDQVYLRILDRTISELFLRTYLLLNSNNNNLSKKNFRTLKDMIKDVPNKSSATNCFIGKLESYFSRYSETIHNKNLKGVDEIKFLSSQFLNPMDDYNKQLNFYNAINESIYILIFQSIPLPYSRLGSSSRVALQEFLSNKKFNKVTTKYLK
ncbi:hypothetical protein LCW_03360 [Latilactobacillus curvatus]|uniref:hypothetical protein n=1 Tax=Latilactobacillus curvatus TaxID=28038 RepID=UPI00084A2141|nr:hypothetical protein [Latilactobacillus curvatus]AOO75163.1 hypothetical protein LCW_03360 [Latilactobacillus curvatus]